MLGRGKKMGRGVQKENRGWTTCKVTDGHEEMWTEMQSYGRVAKRLFFFFFSISKAEKYFILSCLCCCNINSFQNPDLQFAFFFFFPYKNVVNFKTVGFI